MTFPFPFFSAGGVEVEITLVDSATDGSDTATYNFLSTSFGAADVDRFLAVGVSAAGSSGALVNSVSIGGNSASKIVGLTHEFGGGSAQVVELWGVAVAAGTSGTVTVVFNSSMFRCIMGIWRIISTNHTASDTATSNTDPLSGTVTVPSGGGLIAMAGGTTTPASFTWTNATEGFDLSSEGTVGSGAQSGPLSAGDVTVTATPAASMDGRAMALASYSG